MKSNAPWSVKGIDRDARETAKEAARREGMTVGEWLNHIIMSASDDTVDAGEIEGLGIRDIAVAVEHISRRIARAEEKSADTAETLARSLGGAVERLQRLERARPAEGAPEDLTRRVAALEEKSSDRQRIDALRALERAVSQVAIQFDTAHKSSVARIAETERQLAALGDRIESEPGAGDEPVAFLKEAIEGLAQRVARAEALAEEAAAQAEAAPAENFDSEFMEKTGLRMRILGDEIKRGGDRMRALEGSISKLVEQIDAAERRSAEGVEKVAETIADLRRQFSDADATDAEAARREFEGAVAAISERTENRIESLQRSFDDMVRRLEAASAARAPTNVAPTNVAPINVAPAFVAAAPLAAAPAPEISVALDDGSIFDDDIDDSFAEIDLDAPAPRPAAAPASAEAPADDVDFDDFDLDFDDADAPPARADDETESVIEEVRAAFGFAPDILSDDAQDDDDADRDDPASAAFGDIGLDGDDDDDAPPVVFGRKSIVEAAALEEAPAPTERAPDDFLKRARLAAREAAAAAVDDEKQGERRQLTARQRAVLAARVKRKKLEEAARDAAPIAAPAERVARAAEDEETAPSDESESVKDKVLAAIARLKARKSAARPELLDDAAPTAAVGKASLRSRVVGKSENPSIVAGIGAAAGSMRARPAIAGLVAAIALAAAALFFLMKDVVFQGGQSRRADAAPQGAPGATPAPALVDPAADAGATTRPRELYLESYLALKTAQTDADERAALKGIEEAAALGHPPAQLQIGEFYKIGQGFEKDLTRARQWYERAANGGNVLAMHRLGVMAARGEGGPADLVASVAWFEQAAQLGLVDSQYNLGATYHPTPSDAGGVQDRAKAYFWYSVAARNGDAQAGSLAAGLSGDLPRAERDRLDAEIAAFAPAPQDQIANEISPAA